MTTKKKTRPWTDEDARRMADLVLMSSKPYPENRGNVIEKDVQTLKAVAIAMDREMDGVERKLEYMLIDYTEDGSRLSSLDKLRGQPSVLNPDRPIDRRAMEYYAYGRGRRIRPSKRKTKIGTVNPKGPTSKKKLQIFLQLNDASMNWLERWFQRTKAKELPSLWDVV